MATTQTQTPLQSNSSALDDYGYPFPPDKKKRLRTLSIRTSKSALGACTSVLMTIVGFLLWLSRRGKHVPPLTPQTFHPRRILVLRLDLIGDLVLSLTVVRALKRAYPDAEIDLLAVPASGKIALHDPDLHEVIGYDPNIWRRPQALLRWNNWRELRTLLKRLRARHYDLAVSVFGPWAATLAVLSGAPRRVGFGRESYFGFMTDSVPGRHWKPGDTKHEVDYCLQLAQKAGATVTSEDRIPRLYVEPEAQQAVARLLGEVGVQEGEDRPLIACHVSSNNGQSKRWPLPYWATLLDRLIREQQARVVLTGAVADLPLIEQITGRMREQPINLAGKTSLPQLAALLQRANLMISGDSGPMHIAAAVGTPLIALHGPTDPAQSGPVSPKATILRSPIWCSPCYRAKNTADCRFYTTQCMKNITPAQVFEVVKEKLQA